MLETVSLIIIIFIIINVIVIAKLNRIHLYCILSPHFVRAAIRAGANILDSVGHQNSAEGSAILKFQRVSRVGENASIECNYSQKRVKQCQIAFHPTRSAFSMLSSISSTLELLAGMGREENDWLLIGWLRLSIAMMCDTIFQSQPIASHGMWNHARAFDLESRCRSNVCHCCNLYENSQGN